MPIRVKESIAAVERLRRENIFAMTDDRALHQDIRELHIAVLNLMPDKQETEQQLLRLLSNSPLQIEVTFVRLVTHNYKSTPAPYILKNYRPFYDIDGRYFDGLIITGAPVENLGFEEVDYWQEFTEILAWAKNHVTSTLYLSWAAQAGLYYHYSIPKRDLPKKLSGVFEHKVLSRNNEIVRGFDRQFFAPHSSRSSIDAEALAKVGGLEIVAFSDKAGAYIISDGANIFVDGHPEYDTDRLAYEYERDREKGLHPDIPENYFPKDDPDKSPVSRWISASSLLFSNWLNYFVYQITPYKLGK